MTDNKSELKPCPFCNKKPEIRNDYGFVTPTVHHTCKFSDIYEGNIGDWNSAFCWKERDDLKRRVEKLKFYLEEAMGTCDKRKFLFIKKWKKALRGEGTK